MRKPEPEHLVPPRTSPDDGTLSPARDRTRSTAAGSHRTALDEHGEQRLFVLDAKTFWRVLREERRQGRAVERFADTERVERMVWDLGSSRHLEP